jgi:hypothetical protein
VEIGVTDKTSRRLFLQGACATTLATWARGLTDYSTGSAALNPAEGMPYKEAPMLAKRVAAGKLPPVEQRLPKNAFVRHVPQIGKYGGTLYDQTGTPGGRFHFDGALIAGHRKPTTMARFSGRICVTAWMSARITGSSRSPFVKG